MSAIYTDTDPRIEELQIKLLREIPAWRKMEMFAELNTAARTLAYIGLRQRHPQADELEIRRRFVTLLYGEDFTKKVFGE